MSQELLSLGLDIVIVVLLATTIIYAYLLNKRLRALRDNREEMEILLRKFYEATAKADQSIKTMKSSSNELAQNLSEKIDKARLLRDEISFMLERGDMVAKQLEGGISASRPEKPAQDLTALLQKNADNMARGKKGREQNSLEEIFQAESDNASSAEKELLKALKGLR